MFLAILLGVLIPVSGYFLNSLSYGFLIVALVPTFLGWVKFKKNIIYTLIAVEAFILLQVYWTSGLNEKSVYSSILLVYCAATFCLVADSFQKKKQYFDLAIFIYFLVVIFYFGAMCGLLSVFSGYNIIYSNLPKPCFPFQEPSQLALFGGPLLIGLLPFVRSRSKIYIFLTLFILGLTLQSITFLAFSIVSLFLICWDKSWPLVFVNVFFILIVAFGIDYIVNDGYFYKRVYGVASGLTYNRSALVYLQSWETVKTVFNDRPFGLGFQSLGTESPNKYTHSINGFFGVASVNRQDGGFLFGKFFSEFGFVSIAALLCYVVFVIRGIRSIARPPPKEIISSINIYASLLVPFFLRDVGYFSYTLIYFFFASGQLWGKIYSFRSCFVADR